ncbi:shufflon protein C [Salmonella enterica]|nr:shufflon protein C [Salmonella enterica]EAM5400219.1 shufflon protein C [Salmonella enterica]EBC2657943.1 shufflon protein C [Salmonella enterica]EBE8946094.1 shufflon protein C [Salmonella enterica]EBT7760005.1 shufflon protein C [Salmonella enterica]
MTNMLTYIAAHLAECKDGVWVGSQMKFTVQTYNIGQNVRDQYIGIHAYCSWTYLIGAPLGGVQKIYTNGNNGWYVTNTPWDGWQTGSIVSVTCLNLPGAGM